MKKHLLKSMLATLVLVTGWGSSAWAAAGGVTTNADIDFSNPITGSYSIAGAVGSMTWTQQWTMAPNITDGILRFGNFNGGVVELQNNNIRPKDVVTISFDMAFGKLGGKHVGFDLRDADNKALLTQWFDAYNGDFDDANPLNLSWDAMYHGSNTPIQERCVYFTIDIDYAAKTITTKTKCYLSGTGKAATESEFTGSWTTTTPIAKFVLTGNINNADRYSTFDNLKITTTEGDYSAATAKYTVKYVYGEEEIKTASEYEGDVDAAATLTSADKASFFNSDETVRYIYLSDDSEGKTIAEDGSTVVTVTFRNAEQYVYQIHSTFGETLLKMDFGTVWEDLNTATVTWPRFIPLGKTLYERAPVPNDLQQKVEIPSADYVVNLAYSESGITDLYKFYEAENLGTSLPASATSFTSRVSNGQIIYGAKGDLMRLPAGTYKVTLGVIGGDNNTHKVNYVVYKEATPTEEGVEHNQENKLAEGTCTANNLLLITSEEFTLTEETTISFTCSDPSSARGIDLIYVQGTVDQLAAARQQLQEALVAAKAVDLDGLSDDEKSEFTEAIGNYEAMLTNNAKTADEISTAAAEFKSQTAMLSTKATNARETAKYALNALISEAEAAYVEGKELAAELAAATATAKAALNGTYSEYSVAAEPLQTALDAYYTANCETVALTADMFYNWDGFGADATKGSKATVDFKVPGTIDNGGMVVGTSTVDYLIYADLTGAVKMQFEGKPGMKLRVLLNRQESNSGPLDEIRVTIGSDGKAELLLGDYKNKYVHINAIKENWSGGGELTAINIVRFIDLLAAPTDALKGVIAKAESICPNVFTEESYVAMDGALVAAREALTAEDATVESLTGAATTLQTKIDALEMAEGYTNLTAEMFKRYESHEATEGTATGCALVLNESSTLPYGDGSVYWLNYADLTGYEKLYVTVTETLPRFCFNRIEDGGNDNVDESLSKMIDIPNNERSTTAYETVAGNTYVIDLAKMTTDKGFAHLHCIKGPAYNVATTVTGMYLYKTPEAPAFDPSTAIVNADFEGEYSVYSNPKSDRAIYQPEGWTITYTGGEENDMTALNSNCLAWNSFSGQSQPTNGDANTYWIRFRWGNAESLTLSQVVTLPAGSYRLSADAFFNGANGGTATISANGVSTNISGNKTWGNYNVDFTVEEETDVTIAFGLKQTQAIENIAAFDNFKLQDLLAAAKESLAAEIAKAEKCPEKEGLADAIAAAREAYTTATTAEALAQALSALQAADKDAVLRYENELSDASLENPLATTFVVNGTFDNNINGWNRTGGFQNNQVANNQQGDFTGNFYENWNGSAKANKMYQTIENIPNGTYKLQIAAFVNTLAAPNESQYVFANDDKTFLTTGAPTSYEVYTFVDNNTVEVGLEQTTATASWMGIDNVSLTYYGAENSVDDLRLPGLKNAYAEAKQTASEAMESEDYAVVTGQEKTNLSAAIAKEEPTTVAGYEEAIAEISDAADAFMAAKPSYAALIEAQQSTTVPDLTYAAEAKKEALQATLTATATSAADAAEKTTAITTALRAYYESNALAEGVEGAENVTAKYLTNYVNPTDVSGWTINNTVGDSKMRIMTNEPYANADGSAVSGYFDSNNWGSAFTTTFTQTVTLPAGTYILSAKARGNGTNEYKVVAGENSVDVNAIGNQGGVFGRGWNDYTVEFELSEEQEIALGMQMATGSSGNWLSFSDFRLICIASAEAGTPDLAITKLEIIGDNPYEVGTKKSLYLDLYFENKGTAAASNFDINLYNSEELLMTSTHKTPVDAAATNGTHRITLSTLLGDNPGVYDALRVEIACADDANQEDNVAELDQPVTLYVLGDADVNGAVDVNDAVKTVGYVLERETPDGVQTLSADVNKSETITVADAVGIVNIALGVQPAEPEPEVQAARGTEAGADYLTMAGSQIGLVNSTAYTAFQMDVTLSDGALLSGVRLSERAQGLTLTYSQVDRQTWRIAALSLDGSAIEAGEGQLLQLDIMGQGTVRVAGIEFADRSARAHELGFAVPTGIGTLYNNKVDAEVYTVGGTRTSSLTKGVNVVRQADGTVRKVHVK